MRRDVGASGLGEPHNLAQLSFFSQGDWLSPFPCRYPPASLGPEKPEVPRTGPASPLANSSPFSTQQSERALQNLHLRLSLPCSKPFCGSPMLQEKVQPPHVASTVHLRPLSSLTVPFPVTLRSPADSRSQHPSVCTTRPSHSPSLSPGVGGRPLLQVLCSSLLLTLQVSAWTF